MTLSYAARLACLSAAVFFLLNLALTGAATAMSPLAVRVSERLSARRAAGFLLLYRLAPALLAAGAVLAVCIPSYRWLEPAGAAEEVGRVCLAAAALSAAILVSSASRGLRAVLRSRHVLRSAAESPCIVMAGILRPRLIVSREVREALTPEQLEAALDHERAHWVSRDNLKRLLLMLAPGPLPFVSTFGPVERAWSRFTEWAADDLAAAGSPVRSLSLASALVRVARLQRRQEVVPLATSLLGDGRDLAARVQRLLHPVSRTELRPMPWVTAIAAVCGAVALLLLHPSTLTVAHGLLERLME